MILPPPLLFPVSKSFFNFVLADINLAETLSFVIKSNSLLRGNFSSSTSVLVTELRLYLFILHTFWFPSHSFIIAFYFEIEAYFKKKLNFIILQLKSDAFPFFFLPSWLARMLHKNETKKLPKTISFVIRTLQLIYFFIWDSNMHFLIKVYMVDRGGCRISKKLAKIS